MNDAGDPRESPSPSAYRQENPCEPPPGEYKPPSLLAEHKGLAILFAVISIGFAVYCLSTPHPRTHRAQPIYIETVSDQESR